VLASTQQVARADLATAAWRVREGKASAPPPPLAAQPHRWMGCERTLVLRCGSWEQPSRWRWAMGACPEVGLSGRRGPTARQRRMTGFVRPMPAGSYIIGAIGVSGPSRSRGVSQGMGLAERHGSGDVVGGTGVRAWGVGLRWRGQRQREIRPGCGALVGGEGSWRGW
jgi:hypothetical protein